MAVRHGGRGLGSGAEPGCKASNRPGRRSWAIRPEGTVLGPSGGPGEMISRKCRPRGGTASTDAQQTLSATLPRNHLQTWLPVRPLCRAPPEAPPLPHRGPAQAAARRECTHDAICSHTHTAAGCFLGDARPANLPLWAQGGRGRRRVRRQGGGTHHRLLQVGPGGDFDPLCTERISAALQACWGDPRGPLAARGQILSMHTAPIWGHMARAERAPEALSHRVLRSAATLQSAREG